MTHIFVRCECRAKLRLKFKVAGKVCRCPNCKSKFTAPDARMFGICGSQVLPVKRVPEGVPSASMTQDADDANHSHPRVSSEAAGRNGQALEKAHSRVRKSIENLFADDELASSAAFALAAHPWPDEPVSKSLIDVIAAEMLPSRNLRHHDPRELAIDRLLRLDETLEFEGETNLAARFRGAAGRLQDSLGAIHDMDESRFPNSPCGILQDLIANPLGTMTPQATFPKQSNAELLSSPLKDSGTEESSDVDARYATIAQLQGAAAAAASTDIGVIHGGNPTGITISQLACELGVGFPLDLFDEHVDALDSRDRDILKSRTYTLDSPEVLGAIAKRWNISRERIRQREVQLREKFENTFADKLARIGSPLLKKHTETILRTKYLHTKALSLSDGQKWQVTAAAAILETLGPWQSLDGWAIHHTLEGRFNCLRQDLEDVADSFGCLSDDGVDQVLDGLFDKKIDREAFLLEVVGLGKTLGVWTIKDTLRCKVVAALRYLRRPSTKEEIADLLLLPHANVSSTLGTIKGVVRADKCRWGFEDSVEDSYDGIFGEIKQRIDNNGGVFPVNVIVRELPSRFGVSESSVRAYLSSDAFVIEEGLVRNADDGEYTQKSPKSCTGSVRIEDKWGQRLILFERHFVGYSLAVSFDIAFANGIRPNDDLVLPITGHNHEVSVIWRQHSLSRTIDVGRVSDFLESSGYSIGDEIVVIPQREVVEILSVEDVASRTPSDASIPNEHRTSTGSYALIGEDSDDVRDPLLDLLGD